MRDMEFGWAQGKAQANTSFNIKVNHDIEDRILDLIKSKIDIKDSTLKLLFPSQTPAGSYHLISANKSEFFIRVTSRIGDFDLENKFVDYLTSNDVPVNNFLFGGINFAWNDIFYRIDVRPFLNGYHYSPNIEDFKKLIYSMKIFHKFAKSFPANQKIRLNQKEISKQKNKTKAESQKALRDQDLKYFGKYEEWVKNHHIWLDEILEEFDPHLDEMPNAQCLHGQIHPGNTLFVGDEIVLFDTETSINTFAPVYWDYSWVFQRFIINQDVELEDSLSYIKLLANSKKDINKLISMTKQNIAHSVVTVFDYFINEGILVPQSELDKFYNNSISLSKYELFLREVYEI